MHALRPEHGAPLRLVVPGWYAVASVKWLARIDVSERPFHGYFQTDRYRYLRPDGSVTPVTRMRVRSLLLSVGDVRVDGDPATGARPDVSSGLEVAAGPTRLHGIAWSGHAPVERVQVSLDDGVSWQHARLERGSAAPGTEPTVVRDVWTADVELAPGEPVVVVRARDAAGNAQPLEPWSNELGYGNNVVHRVRLRVR